MTKKEYILKLLGAISPDSLVIAWDLKTLIQANQISDELIDSLILIFWNALKNTDNAIEKNKIEKWINILTSLKNRENQSMIEDQTDIANLENLINQI
jgi:DnaJ-domain-containing protein 1